MKLREILEGEMEKLHKLNGTEDILDVSCDSKRVKEGSLFFAMKGIKQDGYRFIPEAIHSGAVAGVVEELRNDEYPQVVVKNIRKAYAVACSRIFDDPSKRLTVIGITGTNGKTTITYMIESVMNKAGIPVGVIGTTGYRYGDKIIPAELTTPDAKVLNELMNEMVNRGVRVLVMEVSSHALDLGRVWGIHFDVGIFTNLTRDHLDFHGTIENYFQAKRKLFSLYLPASQKKKLFAIINNDDQFGRKIDVDNNITKITFGIKEKSDAMGENIILKDNYSEFIIRIREKKFPLRINFIGKHNVYNALSAFSACFALGINPEIIIDGIEELRCVPGRLEPVENDKGIRVLVDYAHTPDALENVILSLKDTIRGRLITIFGCGGDRDRGKRPLMGEISGTHSDITIITSDNPRTEEPEAIIRDIEQGIIRTGIIRFDPEGEVPEKVRGYTTVTDRKKAIEMGLKIAKKGDTVLIAGKGHEDYQIIGTRKVHFSDKEIVRDFFLRKRENACGTYA